MELVCLSILNQITKYREGKILYRFLSQHTPFYLAQNNQY